MNELYLQHHGILGQKWGVRRYQNYDGTLTSAGAKRRTDNSHSSSNSSTNEKVNSDFKTKAKKAAKIAGGVALAGAAAYGGYKVIQNKNTRKAAREALEAAEKYRHDSASLNQWIKVTKASETFKNADRMSKRVGDLVWEYQKAPYPGAKSKEVIRRVDDTMFRLNQTNSKKPTAFNISRMTREQQKDVISKLEVMNKKANQITKNDDIEKLTAELLKKTKL